MPRKRIVVVNHDDLLLDLLTSLLEDEGYDVETFVSATEAYQAIRETQPDLLILDVQLENPQPNWTVLDIVRLDPVTTLIPAIVSATDEQFLRSKEATLRRHHTEVLPKPFNLDELLEKIQFLIGQ